MIVSTPLVSVGANASIIHYKPTPNECATITSTEVYLCDTGGQYGDGTTDITRTNHFGKPSDDERRCYTRVLQGHVGMARAIFPEGTPGRHVRRPSSSTVVARWIKLSPWHGPRHGELLKCPRGPVRRRRWCGNCGQAVRVARREAGYLNEIRRGHYVSDEPGSTKMAHSGSASRAI